MLILFVLASTCTFAQAVSSESSNTIKIEDAYWPLNSENKADAASGSQQGGHGTRVVPHPHASRRRPHRDWQCGEVSGVYGCQLCDGAGTARQRRHVHVSDSTSTMSERRPG